MKSGDIASASLSRKGEKATLSTYADERDLRWKRREFGQVEAADSLDQTVLMLVPQDLYICESSSMKRLAYRGQLRVSKTHLGGIGDSDTAFTQQRYARMPAHRTEGGGNWVT